MKKATYSIVYAATLIIGVLLLVFSREPLTTPDPTSLRSIVVASGIVFIVIGIINFIFSLRKKATKYGVVKTRPWYVTAMAIAALFWGVLMIVMSRAFTTTLAVTLGVSLILAAIAQIIWIASTSRTSGVSGWWFVVPFAVLCAGIVDITLVNDFDNIDRSSATACVVSGILLLCYAVNGFVSLKNIRKAHAKAEAKALRDAEKARAEAAKPNALTEPKAADKTVEIAQEKVSGAAADKPDEEGDKE
jgi:uncharacterized membrane protein HdeD (DUF308 family)